MHNKAKASNEIEWINQVDDYAKGNFAIIAWSSNDIKNNTLQELIV